jgi:predicted dehydrogenase
MKVLIVGFGSIGKRHAENFKQLGLEVALCSKRDQNEWKTYSDLETALEDYGPEFVVISNETSLHHSTLKTVLKKTKSQVLVEKPLFDRSMDDFSTAEKQRVSVAYNLRFHPLIQELQNRLSNQSIVSWLAYVGQNLSTWRPQRDYKEVYSAKKSMGGGALRDLSHELDMFQFLAGKPELLSSHGGKLSTLETDADDVYSVLVKSKVCAHGNIHMNCVDHLTQRRLTVITNTQTFELDLIAGTLKDNKGPELASINKNESYLQLAKAFLNQDKRLCSFEEGLNILELIEKAEG